MLHFFPSLDLSTADLPSEFTYPFRYSPHPLCVEAAQEVQRYLATQHQWMKDLDDGKMFGVLLVQTPEQKVGFLAAFSGNLAGSNKHTFFVPPVYDLLQPQGFFKREEEQISLINKHIEALMQTEAYQDSVANLKKEQDNAQVILQQAKAQLKRSKLHRDELRLGVLTETLHEQLIHESQFQKAEYKRLEQSCKERIRKATEALQLFECELEKLRTERKQRSAALQIRLFKQFSMLNAKGEQKDLCEIFKDTPQGIPPAGAGECAAPKLLQYAYLHQLKPLAMAEFWWGKSPKTEIRHHGHFYPSCKGKCGPILRHMLKGLRVEPNPLLRTCSLMPQVIFEDEWLLAVNKPSGLLSVPGKEPVENVFHLLQETHPELAGLMVVHRLDMDTSGILLLAKDSTTGKRMQRLFEQRQVQKLYIALLEGKVFPLEGEIKLSLRMDPMDRPRQIVDELKGKEALTRYKVLERDASLTRVCFYPITGRTHQLRVHASHVKGLNCPIKGDALYGTMADRLYLHASYVSFIHPKLHTLVEINCPPSF